MAKSKKAPLTHADVLAKNADLLAPYASLDADMVVDLLAKAATITVRTKSGDTIFKRKTRYSLSADGIMTMPADALTIKQPRDIIEDALW